MKISVAITTYGGQRFIGEQLQSLLAQTRQPDEVVICDDRSKDDTVAVVQEFISMHGLTNWTVVRNEENLGYIENFRKAMGMTTGELVLTCDQDDIWYPEKLAITEQLFQTYPQMLACACDYEPVDADGNSLDSKSGKLIRKGLQKPDDMGVALVDQGVAYYSNVAQGCACAYRRRIVEAYCAMNKTAPLPHDWAMNLLAHEKKGLFFVNKVLLGYRIHGNNTIGIPSAQQAIDKRIPLLQEYAAVLEQAAKLPQSQDGAKHLAKLACFTRFRVRWLQNPSFFAWCKGFFRTLGRLPKDSFLQYVKDLYLVLTGKIRRGSCG